MTLYEIDKAIMECIDSETGEVLDEEKLTALAMDRNDKIENVALWIKDLTAEAAALKAEKEVFAARQKAAEDKIDSLKKWLSGALAGQKFETTKCKVAFRKSQRVVIDDIKQVPDVYWKYAEPTADKTAIKEALKEGAAIAGAHIEESTSVSVK